MAQPNRGAAQNQEAAAHDDSDGEEHPEPRARLPIITHLVHGAVYPLRFEVDVDLRFYDRKTHVKKKPAGALDWTFTTKVIEQEHELNNIHVELICTPPPGRFYNVDYDLTSECAFITNTSKQKESSVFSEFGRSVMWNKPYAFPRTRDENPLNMSYPIAKLVLTIKSVEELKEFSWHNIIWPYSTHWMVYRSEDKEETIAMCVNKEELSRHHGHLHAFLTDLGKGKFTKKQAMALFEFCALFFNRWYFGTPKFEETFRNGYMLGFSNNWEYYDRTDCEVPFQIRVLLPLYQHFERADPTLRLMYVKEEEDYRSHMQKFVLLIDVDDAYRSYIIVPHVDSLYIQSQITFFVEKTRNNQYLLIAGINYQIESDDNYKVHVTVMVRTDDVIHLEAKGSRVISKYQKTFGMVVGRLSNEIIASIEQGVVEVVLHTSQCLTSDIRVVNYMDVWNAENYCMESSLSMPGPVNDVTWMKNAEKDYREGKEVKEPPREFIENPTAWMICRDGKIAVSREFLGHRSDYFYSVFNTTAFPDCGGPTVNVDEELEIVLEALDIIWHRSHVLKVDTVDRVLALGSLWICPTISDYIELAVLQTDQFSETEKASIGREYDLQMIKYILRNPEYSTQFKIVVGQSFDRRMNEVFANELDYGKNGSDEPGCSGIQYRPEPMDQSNFEWGRKRPNDSQAGPSSSSQAGPSSSLGGLGDNPYKKSK